MPNSGYPLDAYLVMDNNAIVNLCEFYCDVHKNKPFPAMISATCDDMTTLFNTLRRLASGNKIYTSSGVMDEFKPEQGVIANYYGFSRTQCDCLKNHIHQEIEALEIDFSKIPVLRSMRQAPSKFGSGLSRISDQDLSLVILALKLVSQFRQRVYILTDEEDLRSFVSWMKTKPEVKALCLSPEQIQALHSFIYIDSAHRSCAFSTEQVYQFLSFLSIKQLERQNLMGTTKGELITQTYKELFDAIKASSEIKRQNVPRSATA